MPTISFETVIGGEAAKLLSPQPKRGHRWPINQCPPWGATQINKEGFFSLLSFFSLVAGRTVWEPLEKNFIIHSVIHTYVHTYYKGCIYTSWLWRQEKGGLPLLRPSKRSNLGHKGIFFVSSFIAMLCKGYTICNMVGLMLFLFLGNKCLSVTVFSMMRLHIFGQQSGC